MDSFSTQGFAPASVKVPSSASAQLAKSASKSALNSGRAATAKEAAIISRQAPTGEDRVIKGLRKVEFWGNMPFQFHFIGGLGVGIGSWGLAKAGNLTGRTYLKRSMSWIEALEKTKIRDFREFRANEMAEWAASAKESALLSTAKNAIPKADKTWNPLKHFSNVQERKEKIKEFIKKTELAEHDLSKVKGADKAVDLYHKISAKADVLQDAVVSAKQERLATKAMATAEANVASSASFAAKAGKAVTSVESGLRGGLEKIDRTVVGSGIQKMTNNLPKWEWLSNVRGKNVTELASSLKHGVSGMSMFAGIVALGTTAAVGATWLSARKEKREARGALKDLENGLGPDNSWVRNMRESYTGGKGKRALGTTASIGGHIMEGVMFSSLHNPMGGYGMMAAQMTLPSVGSALAEKDPKEQAYEKLKQADQKGVALKPQERVEYVRHLVSAVQIVKAHGGYYNRLAGPVAEAMVEQGLKLNEIKQLCGNEAQFTAFAQGVADKQKAASETVAAAAPKEQALSHEDTKATDAAVAEAQSIIDHGHASAHHAAPSAMVGAVQHQGRVAEHRRVATV